MGRSRNRRTAWLGIVATELPCTAPPARIDGVVTHLLCYRHGSEQSISLDVISEDRVVLIYSAGGEAVSELVEVERTAQHFRGSRPWWRCPECGRRCRNLHAVDERFRCRTCLGLTYVSSQSTRWIRRVRRP